MKTERGDWSERASCLFPPASVTDGWPEVWIFPKPLSLSLAQQDCYIFTAKTFSKPVGQTLKTEKKTSFWHQHVVRFFFLDNSFEHIIVCQFISIPPLIHPVKVQQVLNDTLARRRSHKICQRAKGFLPRETKSPASQT